MEATGARARRTGERGRDEKGGGGESRGEKIRKGPSIVDDDDDERGKMDEERRGRDPANRRPGRR